MIKYMIKTYKCIRSTCYFQSPSTISLGMAGQLMRQLREEEHFAVICQCKDPVPISLQSGVGILRKTQTYLASTTAHRDYKYGTLICVRVTRIIMNLHWKLFGDLSNVRLFVRSIQRPGLHS